MIEAAEPPHHHHHKTGIPWFDFLVPVAVVCVSIASLLTSLHSERSMEALVEQNRRLVEAQSTPLPTYETGNVSGGKAIIDMKLHNVGTGPAQIFWFRAFDDQGVDFTGHAIEERVSKLDPKSQFLTQPINSTLLKSGDEALILQWPKPTNPAALAEWEKLNHARRYLHLSACYCSIFDECRITDFTTNRPKPVQSCEQNAKQGG